MKSIQFFTVDVDGREAEVEVVAGDALESMLAGPVAKAHIDISDVVAVKFHYPAEDKHADKAAAKARAEAHKAEQAAAAAAEEEAEDASTEDSQ